MSGGSERANGRASGPVLQSVFLAVLDHSEVVREKEKQRSKDQNNKSKEKKIRREAR